MKKKNNNHKKLGGYIIWKDPDLNSFIKTEDSVYTDDEVVNFDPKNYIRDEIYKFNFSSRNIPSKPWNFKAKDCKKKN